MSCQQDHTKLTSNYCPECGAAKPVVVAVEIATLGDKSSNELGRSASIASNAVSMTDKDIAKQLNKIINDIMDETKQLTFYRMYDGMDNQCRSFNQHQLFLKKIFASKINIPDGMVFVITAQTKNVIFTMDEVFESYPFLKDNINGLFIEDYNPDLNARSTKNFVKIYDFLYANGQCLNGKFYNIYFEGLKKVLTFGIFTNDKLFDGTYDRYLKIKDQIVKDNKDNADRKMIINQIQKDFD